MVPYIMYILAQQIRNSNDCFCTICKYCQFEPSQKLEITSVLKVPGDENRLRILKSLHDRVMDIADAPHLFGSTSPPCKDGSKSEENTWCKIVVFNNFSAVSFLNSEYFAYIIVERRDYLWHQTTQAIWAKSL